MAVAISDVRGAVQRLGLGSLPLCVHASLRSFGWVDGGAAAVVEGLLAEGCTVLVPAFASGFRVPPPARWRLPRNGWDYDAFPGVTDRVGRAFTPDVPDVDRDMGAVSATVLACSERVRGDHPGDSFAAVGPLAREVIAGQRPLDVYAPLRAVAARGGAVVLMGVGLDSMTLLHLAEQRAGRALFRRWASGAAGRPVEIETGGCSDGFPRLEPMLAPLARETTVGASCWRAFPAGPTLAAAAAAFRREPTLTHCGRADCERCNDAVLGGPHLP